MMKVAPSAGILKLVRHKSRDTADQKLKGQVGMKLPFFFFYEFIYFIYFYFWLCWVFLPVRGLSLVAASGGYSSLRCVGFSLQWLLLLRSTDSRHMGFSSCGTRAQ